MQVEDSTLKRYLPRIAAIRNEKGKKQSPDTELLNPI